jgi:hypothetical protein
MVQFPNRKLITLGTPWVKAGVLFEDWQQREETSDRIVIKAPTVAMNPRIPAEELEKERAADPENFRREFEAEWIDNVANFIPSEDIDAAIMAGVRALPPMEGASYYAAIDASGLVGKDRFTFAVGHREGESCKTDLLRSWSRQSPAAVCQEIGAICREYRIDQVSCDQFGFKFLYELMRAQNVQLRELAFTAQSKKEIFGSLKLALADGSFGLLDHAESVRELRMLESRQTSGGNLTITAPRGQHDDLATVLALLAYAMKQHEHVILSFAKQQMTKMAGDGAPLPVRRKIHHGPWDAEGLTFEEWQARKTQPVETEFQKDLQQQSRDTFDRLRHR